MRRYRGRTVINLAHMLTLICRMTAALHKMMNQGPCEVLGNALTRGACHQQTEVPHEPRVRGSSAFANLEVSHPCKNGQQHPVPDLA